MYPTQHSRVHHGDFGDTVRVRRLRSVGSALKRRSGVLTFALILVGTFAWLIFATTGNSPPSTGVAHPSSGSAPPSCAGQCGPPFRMDVAFKPDTSCAVATA